MPGAHVVPDSRSRIAYFQVRMGGRGPFRDGVGVYYKKCPTTEHKAQFT